MGSLEQSLWFRVKRASGAPTLGPGFHDIHSPHIPEVEKMTDLLSLPRKRLRDLAAGLINILNEGSVTEPVDANLTSSTIYSVRGSFDSQGLEAKMGIRSMSMMLVKP